MTAIGVTCPFGAFVSRVGVALVCRWGHALGGEGQERQQHRHCAVGDDPHRDQPPQHADTVAADQGPVAEAAGERKADLGRACLGGFPRTSLLKH